MLSVFYLVVFPIALFTLFKTIQATVAWFNFAATDSLLRLPTSPPGSAVSVLPPIPT